MYTEDEYLSLSGVQHFVFCRRQWALIHIEQAWSENVLTTLGQLMHERAHNDGLKERRGGLIIERGLPVHSSALGLVGVCDVVEFHQATSGCFLQGEQGFWRVIPVEYKRGKSKLGDEDRLQLCAQAICLEEMLGCDIPVGYVYYGLTRDREEVRFSLSLREDLHRVVAEMHDLFKKGYTPKIKRIHGCRACSLADICVSKMPVRESVDEYIARNLGELS